ncbi:hypothetical protein SEA_NERUJAY_44 [Mycobacterium phage Nerujay]|uniref:hypothetical protein n=1 Tax=Mycobacterium phage Nerujay TaxID=1647308 RepID=UPI00062434DF|nr:hypothetical protein SEA_NERUJAY_44 [Mycobacterium phage Nerujay]AKF14808.1 hypothetical protein SEA_NERUJAY_44 [Mycobacterium phage Nerujay]
MSKHDTETAWLRMDLAELLTVRERAGVAYRWMDTPDDYIGRHRLPDVRFSQELPDGTVYWSVNRKGFFRRDDSLPSGWVQRIYPRVATSFRTAE